MNLETIASQVLEYVYSETYRPAKPKLILKALNLPEEDYRELRRAIKKLVHEGRLLFGKNHLVLRPSTQADTPNRPSQGKMALDALPVKGSSSVDESEYNDESAFLERSLPANRKKASTHRSQDLVGIFRVAPNRQFGFVRLPRIAGEEAEDEVFIPPRYTKNAMEGDTVKIQIATRGADRIVGRVIEIISRGRREFSGTFQVIDNQAMVWLDGANLGHPVHIGDVRGLPVENDDKVIVELVRFPDFFQPGEAVIIKVLGSTKNPAVDTMAIMHQFGLPEEFSKAAIDEARRHADAFDETTIPEGRIDLTQTPTVTIDPFDARDFDDAISLTKNEKGNWELQVHIADVSHFVPSGGALDAEAQSRATSVYLPDRVIPMIPEIISNHLASLQPDRNRLAKTVFMEFTPQGLLIHTRVFNSVIRNHYRFNYEQIDQYLADREIWRDKLKPEIFQLVGDMHSLAMTLRRIRNEKGALELVLPEVKIDLDKSGKVKGAHLVHHTESHQVIEEFMLAANQAVATWLDDLDVPFLRRAHAPPNRLKLRQLNQFVLSLGISVENLESRFEIQKVVNEVRGKTTEFAVNYAILKSMSKAIYQSGFERHYALNIDHYCHFTSPIRRYPDLVVHRIVQKLIDSGASQPNQAKNTPAGPGSSPFEHKGGEQFLETDAKQTRRPPRENEQILERLGEHCSAMEQNAEAAERELTRIKLLHFLSKRKSELFSGVVVSVKQAGLFVRLYEIPIDGLIPTESLPTDRYRFDRDTHSLEGFRTGNRYRLGDDLVVKIESIDIVQRQLNFRLERILSSIKTQPIVRRRDARPDRPLRGRKDRAKKKRRR